MKEPFCASCVTVPMAFAGSAGVLYGASNEKTTGSNKRNKKMLLISGVATLVIAVIYFMYSKSCSDGTCKYKK